MDLARYERPLVLPKSSRAPAAALFYDIIEFVARTSQSRGKLRDIVING
jgi:hypothetical protein